MMEPRRSFRSGNFVVDFAGVQAITRSSMGVQVTLDSGLTVALNDMPLEEATRLANAFEAYLESE